MYENAFKNLGMVLPFDYFIAYVLRTLEVAPSQLHPNGWAAMQASKVICRALALIPSVPIFLNHYTTQVGQNISWVSLSPLLKESLFNAYTASYKVLKNLFVKIRALGRASFALDSKPLPLYWRLPYKFKGLSKGKLSLEDRANL
ncbi:hypothetical protein CR513_44394, partial [Mucuna pruriens]